LIVWHLVAIPQGCFHSKMWEACYSSRRHSEQAINVIGTGNIIWKEYAWKGFETEESFLRSLFPWKVKHHDFSFSRKNRRKVWEFIATRHTGISATILTTFGGICSKFHRLYNPVLFSLNLWTWHYVSEALKPEKIFAILFFFFVGTADNELRGSVIMRLRIPCCSSNRRMLSFFKFHDVNQHFEAHLRSVYTCNFDCDF
jgi:hypothetical protein